MLLIIFQFGISLHIIHGCHRNRGRLLSSLEKGPNSIQASIKHLIGKWKIIKNATKWALNTEESMRNDGDIASQRKLLEQNQIQNEENDSLTPILRLWISKFLGYHRYNMDWSLRNAECLWLPFGQGSVCRICPSVLPNQDLVSFKPRNGPISYFKK